MPQKVGNQRRTQVYIHIYIYEQPHFFAEKKSRLQGTVFWGPEVSLPCKRDRNRISNKINTHDVPHFLFVKAWITWNEICQYLEDHIEVS